MAQLEDLFDTVDDLNRAIRENFSYITSVDPTICVNNSISLVGVLKVPPKGVRSSEADLSPRVLVCCEVIELPAVNKFDLCALNWSTDVANLSVIREGDCYG